MRYFLCRYSENFCPRILQAFVTLPKTLVKQPLKILDHFQSPGGFLLSISFVMIFLNARFSIVDKVPATEQYMAL